MMIQDAKRALASLVRVFVLESLQRRLQYVGLEALQYLDQFFRNLAAEDFIFRQ
jgi:hypothetical protein